MTDRPLVSIGLPVYNGENYLEETLDSLRKQTYREIEIIIADNASSDRTEEICRAAAVEDERVQYHRHETNLGAPANYNFTVDQAKGEFFMWNAHDDLRAPEFVERAVGVLQERPEVAVVFSQAIQIDEHREEHGVRERYTGLLEGPVHRRFRAAISSPHPSIIVFGLMRLATMNSTERHGTYLGSDRVLAAELALVGPFFEIPEPLFFSRDHPSRYVRMANVEGKTGSNLKQLWWDPSLRGVDRFPRWRRYRHFVRILWRQPLSTSDRVMGVGAVVATLKDNRFANAKVLVSELINAAVNSFRRRKG